MFACDIYIYIVICTLEIEKYFYSTSTSNPKTLQTQIYSLTLLVLSITQAYNFPMLMDIVLYLSINFARQIVIIICLGINLSQHDWYYQILRHTCCLRQQFLSLHWFLVFNISPTNKSISLELQGAFVNCFGYSLEVCFYPYDLQHLTFLNRKILKCPAEIIRKSILSCLLDDLVFKSQQKQLY